MSVIFFQTQSYWADFTANKIILNTSSPWLLKHKSGAGTKLVDDRLTPTTTTASTVG